ncbi:Ubiquitin carboxyl-terminal hydrolase family protein [Brugia malayi]|uniref:Ubiquitin carboxyl-terminal hydrolase n=2 Tax=Brugia TaxID=6278 RepID=A0A4E9FFI6_BRUMA|nr:Ubiquitin carboxyl-terminal hydrolase family protein [Brugia malayi]VIO95146.1 Ubiquitin carboxyl-terminal hydrolase family protein [Brugia malayi]
MAEICETSSSSSTDRWSEMDVASKICSLTYRPPTLGDKIFKDECMYCFKTPLHPGGLYVCLEGFSGFCIDHAMGYYKRTARKGFLWCKQVKKMLPEAEEPQDKVTKLAIGVEGGFSSGPKYEIESEYAVVLLPDFDTKVPLSRLTPKLTEVCQIIIENEGVQRQEIIEEGINVWEGEARVNTRHLNLEQMDNGKRIPPWGWKCEEEGCDLKENLWLNLTDGAIMCGRSQFIQEGVMSKGRNHARLHFDLTGYPLVVKLGTITKDDADVFSYDEDESVRDPNLKKHLIHFGIDMDKTEKTEKSTLEMELDLNQKWEWEMCQEDGANLELVYGPGLTGIINIGSSCYISATLQMLLQIPDIVQAYGIECEKHFLNVAILDSHYDFNCQTAKVFSSLLSGEFSQKDSDCNGIKPVQFRKIASRGNAEFSSTRQQDVDEYIRLLFDRIDEFMKKPKPVDAVRFKLEQRLEDKATNRVRYSYTEEVVLSLNVPEKSVSEQPVKTSETETPIRPTVSFAECLSATFGKQHIDDFRSPITDEVKGAIEQYSIATFPDYLIIQLKKFTLAEDYSVKKLDVNVEMPDEINLEAIRGYGKQPEEMLLPHASAKSELTLGRPLPGIDPAVFEKLCKSGITPEAARRAIHITKNTGFDAALDWYMRSVGDRDINEEHPDLWSKASDIDGIAIEQLTNLGFSVYQARYALQKVNTGINDAADWLFSNVDTIPPERKDEEIKEVPKECRDGKEHYRLIGFISHMGSSPLSGHYVAHMKKDSKWYLFNDEKVALSQNPPTMLGYVYLYERCCDPEVIPCDE